MAVNQKIREVKPGWAREPLLVWDEALLQKVGPFITDVYQSTHESVNVYSVIGSDNAQLIGKSWGQLMDECVNLEQLSQQFELKKERYYSAGEAQNPLRLLSMDGIRWYVQGDAIYDVALARYDLADANKCMLHGVTKIDTRVDWTMFRYYSTLQGLIKQKRLDVRLSVENIIRSDTEYPGFSHRTFHVLVSLEYPDGRSQNLARKQVEEMIARFSEKNGMFDNLIKQNTI